MHLFAVVHTIQALLEKCLKNKLSKYSRVGSCFDDLDTRNTMLQSEFILDIPSGIYGFFLSQTCLYVDDVIVLSYLHAYTSLPPCVRKTVIFVGLDTAHT